MKSLAQDLLQWRTGALLGIALLVRLFLAPYPGFVGDLNGMVQYARVTAQGGLFAVRDIPTTELWPAGFVYHEYAVGRLLKNRLRKAESQFTPSSLVERLGVRVFPIAYDMLIGVALLVILARYSSRQAAELGAAIYLLNPGTILDSSLWNYDSVASFYILLAVFFLGMAVGHNRPVFWILAWGTAGLAFCSKLQAGMLLPIFGLITLLTRKPGTIVRGAVTFLVVVILVYAPFLIGEQWKYLRRVFVDSFHSYPVTTANAYNLWGLWFQMPTSRRIAGVTLESIGRLLYLASMAWLAWQIWKQKVVQATGMGGLRRVVVACAYGCFAPFVVLTRMHERYVAPAVAVCILAGMLDRRLRPVMWGVSVAYGLNLLAVMLQYWQPWSMAAGETVQQAVHASFVVLRAFCSLLNVGLFAWMILRLPALLSETGPASEPETRRAGLAPERSSASVQF